MLREFQVAPVIVIVVVVVVVGNDEASVQFAICLPGGPELFFSAPKNSGFRFILTEKSRNYPLV